MSGIKYMNVREFRELGLLLEVNRTFFHPLGLALDIKIDDEGNERLFGIWDCRDDKEGVVYDLPCEDVKEKFEKAQAFIEKQHKQRYETLGYIIQELDET